MKRVSKRRAKPFSGKYNNALRRQILPKGIVIHRLPKTPGIEGVKTRMRLNVLKKRAW